MNGTFTNPILAGDYADPSIIRVGDVYYMTHSSFPYGPGLLLW
ncbi:MAG: family 43 glycosylhydrolase, partial [Tepidisphaeraceae bacterium]